MISINLLFMVMFKEMPYNQKLEGILEYKKLVEGFAPQLVNSELGKEKVNELYNLWKKESELVPNDASDQDKYEVAYRNFLQNWLTANRFMTENRGEDGNKKFMSAAINAWKQMHAGTANKLRLLGSVSSKTAFRALAEQLAYHLQIFSPFSVSELNENRLVLNLLQCKIMDVRKRNDFCLMACQNIIPAWLEEQFNVRMNLSPQGASCTVIITHY
jgi:hypothetical protein